MDSLASSDNIRKSFEARRRHPAPSACAPPAGPGRVPEGGRAAAAASTQAGAPRADGAPALSDCSKVLEATLRESIRSSFSQWRAALIEEVSGLARGASAGAAPPSAPAEVKAPAAFAPPARAVHRPPSVRPSGFMAEDELARTAPPAPAAPVAPRTVARPAPATSQRPVTGKAADTISWTDLVQEVQDLRREWNGENFETRFGGEPGEASVGESPLAAAPAPIAETVLRDPPAPAIVMPEAPEAAMAAMGEPEVAGTGESADSDIMGRKLDELIHLVKDSLVDRTGKSARITPDVSAQIAREVAGRLKDSLRDTLSVAPREEAASPAPPPHGEAPIPFDDIAAMIDRINGSRP